MDELEVRKLFARVQAVIDGSHIVYTSGKHGPSYVNKDAMYPHTTATSRLCRELATRFADDGVEVVVAPAIGAVILSQHTAFHLTSTSTIEVLGVYAEKETVPIADPEGLGRKCYAETGAFALYRGYDKFVIGKRVLIVEDVLTTGGSVRKVVDVVRKAGGTVVGVGALCNRGGITEHDIGDVPKLVSLMNVRLEAWDEADCVLCLQKVPMNTEVGKGKEFLAKNQK